MKKNLACEILRARAVCKAIFSLPRAAHPRGAFFIFIGKFHFHTLTYHAISYEIKKNPASRILFYSLFRCDVSLCFQKLCAEHCTARGAAHGIVGQSHELPVIDRVLSQTSYRDTHTVLIVDIQSNLRAVILLEILDKMLQIGRASCRERV